MAGRALLLLPVLLAALGGCTGGKTLGPALGGYNIAESRDFETAPWPRLVDIPDAPAPGEYTAAVPDPAPEAAEAARLQAEAARMKARAEALARPVLTAEERRRLLLGARAVRE